MIFVGDSEDARLLIWAIKAASRGCHDLGIVLPARLAELYDALVDLSGLERTETEEPTDPVDDALMLTTLEAAARLKLSDKTVGRLIKSGELRSVTIGRARRIRPDDLERYVEAL